MTVGFWSIGLQAFNVLVLVWLLSRVFWRPVAGAITARQSETQTMLVTAKAARDKADATLTEVTQVRARMDDERKEMIAKAAQDAEVATRSVLVQAHEKADALMTAANRSIDDNRKAAASASASDAASLALDIAARLLTRLDARAVHTAFFTLLAQTLSAVSDEERAALIHSPIDLISALELTVEERTGITEIVRDALGGTPTLRFVTDPDLIAGLELRTEHFVLHNSWRADLSRIETELTDAA